MTRHGFGNIVVHRIVESICSDFDARAFFPGSTPEDWARHQSWLAPAGYDPSRGTIVLTIQAFLVRTSRHTILVDTCVGDDKSRPARPFWHMQKLNAFLPRLAALGVAPDDIDYVMCTHLHADHVGWNTRLENGRWVPTFPKARYVFAKAEWAAFEALHRNHPQPQWLDSVLPLMEAGQAQLVASDFALDDEVWLEPSPGHTPGHVCVRMASRDRHAIVTGDCIHSPIQCLEPHWIMRADSDPHEARRTRRAFLERCAANDVLVCATHFPEPSFGRVVPHGEVFRFEYETGA